jgi:hypothetical protein
MVASSVLGKGAALWFDVSLLITTTGCYDWGASPLLFCTVIWCMTHRPGCYMCHMSVRGSTTFMKANVSTLLVRRRSTRQGLVFAASRDPSIQTRTKKGEGGSFPAWQAGEFGIVCSRQRGRKGNKQIKVERLSFGKIWYYGVRTHYGGSTTYYSLLSGL